jgi:hypothetical protein
MTYSSIVQMHPYRSHLFYINSSIPGDLIIYGCRIFCTFLAMNKYFINHLFEQRRVDRSYHFPYRYTVTEKFEGGGAPDPVAFSNPLICHDVNPYKDDRILILGCVSAEIGLHLVAECTAGTVEHDRHGFLFFLNGFLPGEVTSFYQQIFSHQVPLSQTLGDAADIVCPAGIHVAGNLFGTRKNYTIRNVF